MFFGLTMTSLLSLVMSSALFQRKARAGWIDELDGIREEALSGPDHEVVHAIASEGEDLWTDLRAGGEYNDPHEIASLYASDETPDGGDKRTKGRSRSRARGKDAAEAPVTGRAPAADPAGIAPPAPLVAVPAPHHEVVEPAPLGTGIWTAADDEVPTGTVVVGDPAPGEPIWVQPAPHPMRPQEMWHPAEAEVAPLTQEPGPWSPVAEAPSLDHAPVSDAAAFASSDPRSALSVEHAAAVPTPGVDAATGPRFVDHRSSTGGWGSDPAADLGAGTVGRRVRRDRPSVPSPMPTAVPATLAPSGPLDAVAEHPAPLPQRGERSPLPEVPLPPAAFGGPGARGPLGDAPSASPAPSLPAFDEVFERAFEVAAPVATAPAGGSVSLFGRPPVPEPVIESAPEPRPAPTVEPPVERSPIEESPVAPIVVEEPAAATPLAIGDQGLVPVPGTIVRVGGAASATASQDRNGPTVLLIEGWTWVAPGDGPAVDVHVDVPVGRITFAANATGLAVVEGDGSSFVIVACGEALLLHGGERTELGAGAIAMIDPHGSVQVDQATQDEVIADPVVELNLSLDAEL